MYSDSLSMKQLIREAQAAAAEGNLDQALSGWERACTECPEDAEVMLGCGSILRRLRRFDEADAILEEGLRHHPNHLHMHAERAWVAYDRREWNESYQRWLYIRNHFPDKAVGYEGILRSLRESAKYDEADSEFRTALKKFPLNLGLLEEFAWVAIRRRDWPEALLRWSAVRALFPERPSGYLGMANALRSSGAAAEAENILLICQQKFPENSRPFIDYAWAAQHRRDWSEALKRWEVVTNRFPGVAAAYYGAAQALRELGRPQDAEVVLAPAIRLFPKEFAVFSTYASLATLRKDRAEAQKRWQAVIDRFPDVPDGYLGAADAAKRMDRLTECKKLLEDCIMAFPKSLQPRIEYARLSDHINDLSESRRRWKDAQGAFPNSPEVIIGLAVNLRSAERFDEADSILKTILEERPDQEEAWRQYAIISDKRLDWPESHIRWELYLSKFPGAIGAVRGLSAMFRETGRFDDSVATLNAALKNSPGNIDLEQELAITATERGDWADAFRRWEMIRRQLPHDAGVRHWIARAVWKAQLEEGISATKGLDQDRAAIEIPSALSQPDPDLESENIGIRELVLNFESLGDTCEFGMVQRRFGAEPVGLLRWVNTSPHKLVQALEEEFIGVGEPSQTSVYVYSSEYWVRDNRYNMYGHTFTNASSIEMEVFNGRQCKRMSFLRRKLIQDLVDGDKIFVYCLREGLSYDQATAIGAGIKRYNKDGRLLCVFLEEPENRSGTVRMDDRGFLVGYIDHFSVMDINVDAWVAICKSAYEICENIRKDNAITVAPPVADCG